MVADLEQGLIGDVAALVHTGDTIDGIDVPAEDAYALEWLDDAAKGVPTLLACGNHDLRSRSPHTRAAWEAVYGRPANTFLDVEGYRLITWSVDSHTWDDHWIVPGATWSWLAETIEGADGPVVLAQHFPPWELTQWAGNTVEPAETFAAIIGDYPQVVGLMCGHQHWDIDDPRAARFVTMGGRSIPVLTDISSMLSIDGLSRDQSAQRQSYSAYVTLYDDRWEVRYRAHGTHAWSGPGGLRVTTLDLATGAVSRGM